MLRFKKNYNQTISQCKFNKRSQFYFAWTDIFMGVKEDAYRIYFEGFSACVCVCVCVCEFYVRVQQSP